MSSDRRDALLQSLRKRTGTLGAGRAAAASRWNDVTPIRRDELVADQLAHLPFGTRRAVDAAAPVRAGASGSGAELLVLTWTEHDLARERAAGARLFGHLGMRPGMRVANALAGALVTPGALLVGDVVDELGALDVPLGEVRSEAAARSAWALIDRVEPQILILDAASAGPLFTHAPSRPRPWWQGILWLASATPTPAASGFDGWQRQWLAVPEISSFIAGTCDRGNFHDEDDVVSECLDEHLTVTAFGRDDSLLRFVSPWRVRSVDTCPCGAGAAFALA